MELPRGRGRPRLVTDDAQLERQKEIRRQRYQKKKENDEASEVNRRGRPNKEEGTEEEMEMLRRRRQRYAEGKEERRERGRPKTVPETEAQRAKREADRRYREKKKQKLMIVKLYPTLASVGSDVVDGDNEETDGDDNDDNTSNMTSGCASILRSPSRVSKPMY